MTRLIEIQESPNANSRPVSLAKPEPPFNTLPIPRHSRRPPDQVKEVSEKRLFRDVREGVPAWSWAPKFPAGRKPHPSPQRQAENIEKFKLPPKISLLLKFRPSRRLHLAL